MASRKKTTKKKKKTPAKKQNTLDKKKMPAKKKPAKKTKKKKAVKKEDGKRAPRRVIPRESELLEAIVKVLDEQKMVRAQYRMRSLVEQELRKADPEYRVSGTRVRKVALASGKITLDIHCRETPDRRAMYKCPVCGTKLKQVKNQTVYGGTVTLEHRCPHCGYWTGLRRRVPTRYVFTLRGKHYLQPNE